MREVVVVTGGSGGIGAAAARLMAGPDRAFAIHYSSNAARADAVAQEVAASGAAAIVVQADMTDEADIVRLFETAAKEFGHVTGAIASAGTDTGPTLVRDLDHAEIMRVYSLNCAGVMITCREALRHMPAEGNRAIVAVSSMAATIGGRTGRTLYAASKGAVDVFTKGFAKEVAADGIRVNAVRPGMTETDMIKAATADPARAAAARKSIPLQRFARPDEVGAVIAFLMSEKAGFVTGAVVDISGGGFVI